MGSVSLTTMVESLPFWAEAVFIILVGGDAPLGFLVGELLIEDLAGDDLVFWYWLAYFSEMDISGDIPDLSPTNEISVWSRS